MFSGLRVKFIAIVLCTLGAVFAVITVLLVMFFSSTLRNDLNQSTSAFSSLATPRIGQTFLLFQNSGRLRIEKEVDEYVRLNSTLLNVRIVDNAGNVVYEHSTVEVPSIMSQNVQSFDPQYIYSETGVITQAIVPYEESAGVRRYSVVYDISANRINARISQVQGLILIFGLIAVLATAGGVILFTNYYILGPIHRVSNWAKRVSGGNYQESSLQNVSPDEIGEVTKSVSDMALKLQDDILKLQNIDKLKSEFMMITSHNLRTPLTELKGAIEFLENQENLPTETNAFIRIINKGTKQLGLFIEVMLTVARIETGQVRSASDSSVNISEIMDKINDELGPNIVQKQLSFNCTITGPGNPITINEEFLKIMIRSLLDNSIKFTPKNGTINLKLHASKQQLFIEVTDSGVGISKEEQAKLFTKFHRGTSTMLYNYEGTGLGLYLVKLIVNLYQGTVNVESEPNTGTTVRITLPIKN